MYAGSSNGTWQDGNPPKWVPGSGVDDGGGGGGPPDGKTDHRTKHARVTGRDAETGRLLYDRVGPQALYFRPDGDRWLPYVAVDRKDADTSKSETSEDLRVWKGERPKDADPWHYGKLGQVLVVPCHAHDYGTDKDGHRIHRAEIPINWAHFWWTDQYHGPIGHVGVRVWPNNRGIPRRVEYFFWSRFVGGDDTWRRRAIVPAPVAPKLPPGTPGTPTPTPTPTGPKPTQPTKPTPSTPTDTPTGPTQPTGGGTQPTGGGTGTDPLDPTPDDPGGGGYEPGEPGDPLPDDPGGGAGGMPGGGSGDTGGPLGDTGTTGVPGAGSTSPGMSPWTPGGDPWGNQNMQAAEATEQQTVEEEDPAETAQNQARYTVRLDPPPAAGEGGGPRDGDGGGD